MAAARTGRPGWRWAIPAMPQIRIRLEIGVSRPITECNCQTHLRLGAMGDDSAGVSQICHRCWGALRGGPGDLLAEHVVSKPFGARDLLKPEAMVVLHILAPGAVGGLERVVR